MPVSSAKKDSKAAFDLKGAAFTILVLSLRSSDLDAVAAQLADKVRQVPEFFHQAPLVLDLRHLPEGKVVDLAELLNLVREQGFVPVGLSGGTDAQKELAAAMNVAALTARSGGRPLSADEIQPSTASSLIVTEPVRSGQSIIAEHGDLIVLNAVSSGAEIKAAGSIHIYGPLRGRAFAGSSRGGEEARIFCQRLEAELVAIAGAHLVSEDFPPALRGKPVQIRLQAGRLHLAAL